MIQEVFDSYTNQLRFKEVKSNGASGKKRILQQKIRMFVKENDGDSGVIRKSYVYKWVDIPVWRDEESFKRKLEPGFNKPKRRKPFE